LNDFSYFIGAVVEILPLNCIILKLNFQNFLSALFYINMHRMNPVSVMMNWIGNAQVAAYKYTQMTAKTAIVSTET